MFIKSLRVLAFASVIALLGTYGVGNAFAQTVQGRSGLEVDTAIRAYTSDEFVGVGIRNFDGARQTENQEVIENAPSNVAAYVVRVVNQGQSTTDLRLHGTPSDEGWLVTYYDRNGEDITKAITAPEGWHTPELSALSAPENAYDIGIKVVADAKKVTHDSEVLLYTTSGISGSRPNPQYSDTVRALTHLRKGEPLAPRASFDASIRAFDGEPYAVGEGIHNRSGREQRCLQSTTTETATPFEIYVKNNSAQACTFLVRCTAPPDNARATMKSYIFDGDDITAQVMGGGWTSPRVTPGDELQLLLSITLDGDTPLGQIREVAIGVARSDQPQDLDVVVAATGLQRVERIQYSLDQGETWQDAPGAGQGPIQVSAAKLMTIGLRVFKAVPNLPWPLSSDEIYPRWSANGYLLVGEQVWVLPDETQTKERPYHVSVECGDQVVTDIVIVE